jgi:quercetin dioxygenase-like cupin family protein
MQILYLDQDQMRRRVARFDSLAPMVDLVSSMEAMPKDMRESTSSQTVYGLTSPTDSSETNFWDKGAVSAGTANFGAVYVRAKPGQGVGSHIHRYSYENFIVMEGTWRIFWNSAEKEEHLDLERYDMISVPPGAMRRFQCVGDREGLLLAFAYAERHRLADAGETMLSPVELDRLETMFGDKGPQHRAHLDRMRRNLDSVSARETEDDRRFAQSVAQFVADS